MNGFYRGMMFPVMTNGMLNSVLFGVYGNELRRLNSICANDAERKQKWRQNVFIAGSEAGFIYSLLSCPIELIKIRLQTQNCTYLFESFQIVSESRVAQPFNRSSIR